MSPVLVFCFVFSWFYVIWKCLPLYRCSWKLSGPWAIPLLGNIQMITKLRPESLFRSIVDYRHTYKSTFRLWLGPQLWVFLHTASETREALRDNTLVKPNTFKLLHPLLGNGLLLSEGKHWALHRRLLSPAFQTHLLANFVPTLCQHATVLVQKLESTQAQVIEVNECLFACVLDGIVHTSMGKQLCSQLDAHSRYTRAFHQASKLLFARMMNPLLMSDIVFERTRTHHQLKEAVLVIHELVETVIRERMQYLESTTTLDDIRHTSLLDTLLTSRVDGESLSLQDVRDEVNTFVFAGVDTTAAAVSFILYALAKYPAEQAKLHDELLAFDMGKAELTLNDINGLPFLDIFIKECLRFYTIVPLTGRQTTADTVIGGKSYCAGVTIWINLYGLSHDGDYFDEPNEFRPERFCGKEEHDIVPYTYLPFSGGPHTCIGRKYALTIIKILTIFIVQRFEISLADYNEELILMMQMVLKSLHGINLIFKTRTSPSN